MRDSRRKPHAAQIGRSIARQRRGICGAEARSAHIESVQ